MICQLQMVISSLEIYFMHFESWITHFSILLPIWSKLCQQIFMMVIDEVFKLRVWCAEESPFEVLDEFSEIFIKSLLDMKIIIMQDADHWWWLMMTMTNGPGNGHADPLINHQANRSIPVWQGLVNWSNIESDYNYVRQKNFLAGFPKIWVILRSCMGKPKQSLDS